MTYNQIQDTLHLICKANQDHAQTLYSLQTQLGNLLDYPHLSTLDQETIRTVLSHITKAIQHINLYNDSDLKAAVTTLSRVTKI